MHQKGTAPERLKAWRVSQKYRQSDAAKRCGATQAMWSLWESGRIRPDAKSCVALQILTGIEPAAWYPEIVEQVLELAQAA